MKADRYFEAPNGTVRRVHPWFHWLGFFFGSFWAFANRGWVLGLVLFLVELPLTVGAERATPESPAIAFVCALAFIALSIANGYFGQAWLAWSFERQGYVEVTHHAT